MSFLTHLKLLTRLPDNHVSFKRQLTLNALQSYFKNWEKQMAEVSNPEIRKLAEERRATLQTSFESIRKYTEPLKAQFNPWMSDLKDLQKYLGNDLTVAGVDAAKTLFTKTQNEGSEVQKSMDALVAELNTIAATLTPAKTGK